MPRRERDDNSRYGRDRRSHSRDDSPHRRRRRSSSRSGDRYDSPRNRVKRESESSPVRVKRGDRYSPTGYRRERSEERSFGHYSKRTQRHRQRESPRRPRSQRSRSPEPWGSHQHDLAYDSAHPPPPPKEKEKPNYGLSGNLAAATNTKNGVVLKYHEPSEAKKTKGWRVYVFKNGKEVDVLELDSQSSYLIGRDRNVVDIPVDHTSCSKQHAVMQFRQVSSKNEFGDVTKAIKPYVIDLDSTNGTILNGSKLDSSRYYEIHTEDMLKFGESTREYIFIKDPSVS